MTSRDGLTLIAPAATIDVNWIWTTPNNNNNTPRSLQQLIIDYWQSIIGWFSRYWRLSANISEELDEHPHGRCWSKTRFPTHRVHQLMLCWWSSDSHMTSLMQGSVLRFDEERWRRQTNSGGMYIAAPSGEDSVEVSLRVKGNIRVGAKSSWGVAWNKAQKMQHVGSCRTCNWDKLCWS